VIVGRLTVTMSIPAARSLKDKRRIVKSLIARIHNQHNAAAAEVGDNDAWQLCRIGVAVVSNQSDHAHSQLSSVVRLMEQEREAVMVDYDIEIN